MGLFDLFKKKPVQQNSAQLSNEEKYGKAWLMIVGQNRQQGLQIMRELDAAGFIEASIALAMFTEDPAERKRLAKKAADAGFQLKNSTTGSQGKGKKGLENGRPARGYFDGKEAGYLMARREVAHWFSLHLNVSMKKPTKNAEKALAKFEKFINLEEENP